MLTDTDCKNAKPQDKPYKKADEKGMYLLIDTKGNKYFRFDYRFGGKRKTLALGVYPETSLKQARDLRDKARQQIADGIDHSENRKAIKHAQIANTENSFEIVVREWFERNMSDKSQSHQTRTMANLSRDVFPWIGGKPVNALKAPELLSLLRKVEERGAITDTANLGALLRAIDGYSGSIVVRTALQIAPRVFVRPGELRAMQWQQIDFDAKEWHYLVTKTRVQHIVPLADQVIGMLKEVQPITGNGEHVFPSERTPNGSRCISDVALLAALRRMGFSKEEVTVHGFRATA